MCSRMLWVNILAGKLIRLPVSLGKRNASSTPFAVCPGGSSHEDKLGWLRIEWLRRRGFGATNLEIVPERTRIYGLPVETSLPVFRSQRTVRTGR